MILQRLFVFIINSFNKQPEIKEQSIIEIIETLLIHFKTFGANKPNNKFMIYTLPTKSYKDFKTIVNSFIDSMELMETPKTIKLQTIEYAEINYVTYFKKGWKGIYEIPEVKADILNTLNKIKDHLILIDSLKDESYTYYSTRAEIVVGHCVNILETIIHE